MNSSNIFSSPGNLSFNSANLNASEPKMSSKALPQMRLESIFRQLGEAYSSQAADGTKHHFSFHMDQLTQLSLHLGSETHEVFRNSADGSVILPEELEGRADEVHQALRHHGYEDVKLVFINSALFKDLTDYIRTYQVAQAAKAQKQDEDLANEQEVEPTPPISRRHHFDIKSHSLLEEERSLLLYMARIKITHVSEDVRFAHERAEVKNKEDREEKKIQEGEILQGITEGIEQEKQDSRIHESINQNGTRSDTFHDQQLDANQA